MTLRNVYRSGYDPRAHALSAGACVTVMTILQHYRRFSAVARLILELRTLHETDVR